MVRILINSEFLIDRFIDPWIRQINIFKTLIKLFYCMNFEKFTLYYKKKEYFFEYTIMFLTL